MVALTSLFGDSRVTIMQGADDALRELLRLLQGRNYRFVTPTPLSHRRVVARAERRVAHNLADMLGWSIPFAPGIDDDVERLLDQAGMIEPCGTLQKSRVRVSALHDRLYLHSAFPTDDEDAVFFGPDSYRFADLVRAELAHCPGADGGRIADIGTGAGVGAVVAATACLDAAVTMTDVNPRALRLARINAEHAGVKAEAIKCEGLEGTEGLFDVVIANPPYIIDDAGRAYRDGGDMHGGRISLDMASQGMERLAPKGRVILYTGSAIVDGCDELRDALANAAGEHGCAMRYWEIDPDVFGEELDHPGYRDVDRIAVIAGVFERK